MGVWLNITTPLSCGNKRNNAESGLLWLGYGVRSDCCAVSDMSSFDNLRSRKPFEEDGNGAEVYFPNETEYHGAIELTKFESIGEDSSGEELSLEKDDQQTLIKSENGVVAEVGIDSDGVVREYEVALEYLGFGLFHILLLFINGTALLSDAIEVLSISFVFPVLSKAEEFGASDAQEGVLGSIIFVGMLFGSYIWGSLADIIGRRTVLVCSLSISAAFGFFSAFVPGFWIFVFFRFLSGFGVGGSLPVIFPYTSEFIRNKYRGPYLGFQSMFWMIGRMLCAGFAWIIIPQTSIELPLGSIQFHSWRLFIAISALPSLIGAVMYFFLPESPRYLLEVGKQEKAMRALRLAYRMNNLTKNVKEYPVKGILLDGVRGSVLKYGPGQSCQNFINRCKEILRRTYEMFKRAYWRRTFLLLVVMFCLSFGGYGVALWFPTYVNKINNDQLQEDRKEYCDGTNVLSSSNPLQSYCGCNGSVFVNSEDVEDAQLLNWKIDNAVFFDMSFFDVTFTSTIFNRTQFHNCSFIDCVFSDSIFEDLRVVNVIFDNVTIDSTILCGLSGVDATVASTLKLKNSSINGEKIASEDFTISRLDHFLSQNATCRQLNNSKKVDCKSADDFRIYRDSFYISASAFPGNIASAIAVYLFPRNYWLAFALFASTLSVFLLYVVTSEAYVVIVLCIFTFASTPAWNDTSLLIAELYPTHLRATAAGIHLLMARIGAILGSNIFGVFIKVSPSIPILLVAALLFAGGVAAALLPKTTRKTLLK